MTNFYFSKAVLDFTEVIIVFKTGELGNPICVLQKHDIERLVQEWDKVIKK